MAPGTKKSIGTCRSKNAIKEYGEDLRAHIALYRVGDRYDVQSLRYDAQKAFSTTFLATIGGTNIDDGLNDEEYHGIILDMYLSGSPYMRKVAKNHFILIWKAKQQTKRGYQGTRRQR